MSFLSASQLPIILRCYLLEFISASPRIPFGFIFCVRVSSPSREGERNRWERKNILENSRANANFRPNAYRNRRQKGFCQIKAR
jgi:hypothetical protein